MASDENVNSDSCIYDPNFAIVCSFFEKFSSICGIKHPAFSDLQQMLDSTDEISPELIDLHVRLMRKAKKNVNPDRWQRTLAKFCYFHSPQESWDLEQNGYKKLNFNQKLKLLLCVCEAQFDLNVKFKNDINKLPIDELRLKPIGKDKDGIMYWIHTDEKLKLKVYKENTEDETFELLASDRDGLAALLEKLRKERDPDRKYDEELSEEEEEEDLKVEPHEKEDVEDETDEEEEEEDDDEEDDEEEEEEEKPPKIRPETTKEQVTDRITTKPESQLEKTPEAVNLPKSEKNDTKPLLVEIPKTKVIEPVKLNIHEQKPPMPVPHKHVDIKTKRFDKAAEIALKKEKVVVNNPVNMKPGEFAQHLEKLHSEKILLPLLTSPLPEKTPFKADSIESLKTKINMKFSMIKPVLQNEVLKSKIEDVKKNKDLYMKNVKKELPGKPGLKLEQILKSKLGQKLAANNPVQITEELTPNEPVDQSSKTDKQENSQKDCAEQIKTLQNELAVTNEKTDEPIKRKISSENDGEPKKLKIGDDDEKEIEEPVMLITGVGSGKECESYPEDEEEEEELEFVLYVSGVGSGVECETGNDETEEDKEKHAPLSHNIKDMLPKNEDEPAAGTSNGDKKEELEKKKPKLWTIDAICNSDSKDSKKEDISCFPNYSFNKDKKPDVPYRNEFSFFNTPMESKESDVKDHVIPSFYFGCDTQNPPYATDARNINSFKSKSHNVKDIMEGEDGKDKNDVNYDGSFKRYEENVNHDSAFNLCTRESPPKKNLEEKSHKVENVYSDVVNLSTSNSVNTTTNENQNESKISNKSGAIENDLSEITEKTLEIEKKEHSSKSRTNEATEISQEQTENSKQNINDIRKLVDASEITNILKDSVENEQIPNIPSSAIDKVQVVSKSSEKNEEFKCDLVLDTHLQSTEKSLELAEEEKPEIFNVNEPNSIKGENSKQIDIEPKSIEIEEKSLNLELKFETEKSIPGVFEKQESVEIDKPKVLEVNDETEFDENKSESACINVMQPVDNDVTQSLHEESKSSVEEPQPTVNESQFVIEESQSFVRQSQSTAEESQLVVEESQPGIEETLSVVEEPQPVAEKPQLSFEESKTPSKDNQKVTSSEASELQDTIQTDKINVNLISKEVESKSELSDKSPIKEVFQESSKLLSEIQENETESKMNADDDSDHVPDIPSDTESCENQKIEKTMVNVEVTHKKPGRTGRPKKSKEPGEGSSSESKPKRGKFKENEETPVLRTSTRLAKSASIKKEETTSKKERKKKSIKDAKESKPGKKYEDESEVKKLRKTADEESDSKTSEDDAKLPSKMSDDFEIPEKPSEDESEIKPLEEKTDVEISKETSEEYDVREAEKPLNPEETESKVEVKVEADETTAADESQPIAEPPKKVGKPRGRKKKRGKPPGRTPKPKPEKVEGGEENETQSIKLNIKKVVKKDDEEQDDKPTEDSVEESKESETAEKSTPTKKRLKRGWLNEIDVNNITPAAGSGVAIRQSRRIAQLKIKEQAEGKYIDQITPTKKAGKGDLKAKQGSAKKGGKSLNKKSSKSRLLREDSDGDDSNYEKTTRKKRKKKDPKKKFKPGTPWKATSDTSTEEEDDDHFDEDDEDEELAVNDVSDHEFSPESDLEDEDFQPVKRARTAHSKPKTEDKPRDDLCCQKCKTAEQPEWILLCDKCDEGWHAACLRPPLMVIPEGDWFCPPCQHNMLICNIHKFLKTYDKNVKKRNNEELRKKRLEYVGISFSNILSEHQKSDKNDSKAKEDEEEFVKYDLSEDNTEDESEEEPLYQLRIRRQANVSYRLSEYDELMNSAIQRENGENGENPEAAVVDEAKPEAVEVPKIEKEEDVKHDVEEKEKEELSDEQDKEEEKVSPMILQLRGIRKKAARLTQLEVSSEDDRYSDEDFKGSSGEDYDEDEYAKSETDSDEARYKKSSRGPVRRSTRARVTRYDNDFINDDESEEDDYEPKKKKKRFRNSESDSEEEDSTWGKRKRSKVSRPFRSTGKKRRRRIVFDGDTDEDKKERKEKKKKSRVTYGLEESEDDYPQRKTRGKKINYLENLGTDSEEESASSKSKNKKILSDDDDYVNEDERNDVGMNANGDKNESVVDEDGVKKFQSSSGSKAEKSSPSNLHELIAANNTGVIRTYSKSNLERNQKSELGSDTSNFDQNESSERRKRKSSNDVQIYSGIVKGDNKLVLKKVDTNPSLEGMHSMAQSLPQMLSSPSKYSISMIQKMVPGDNQYPGLPPGQPNYAEMGINYEDTEGISPNAEHPIRTPSPSKLYSGEGPPPPPNMGRPPPFVVGPGMPPGMPPNIMRGPPPMPHLRGPPPTALPPMSQPPITTANVAVPNQSPIMESPNESPKRRARGRGKKQLEIERMKRESLNRGEEMIPLHLLKPLPSDINPARPSFGSSTHEFGNYPNMPRLPYSTASGPPPPQSAVTVSVGNSKRVKITPTRMRMPTPQNVMRFPRPSMIHNSPMPLDPSPSGGTVIAVTDKTATNAVSPAPSAVPGKEAGKKDVPEQYYPTPYPPASQAPRGFPPRPEFPFVRKPLPPMYQQPIPTSGTPPPRPQIVTTNSVISGPIPARTSPSPSKAESPTPQYSTPYPPGVPPPNVSSTSKPSTPTSQPVSAPVPSTTSYQPLHIKQLPAVPSSGPTASFNSPYYAAPPVPNSYPLPQPPLPPVPSNFPPPVSTLNQPFPVAARIPSQASFVKSPQPAGTESPATTTPSDYSPGTQPESSFQFQECNNTPVPAEGEGQFQQNYDEEESAPAEEQPSGEFGGLVSYFSSQREDDLDA